MICKYCKEETNTTRSHKSCVDKASNARKVESRRKKLGVVYQELVCANPGCGKIFTQTSTIQKFCCGECREVIHLAQNRVRSVQYYKDNKGSRASRAGRTHARNKGEGVAALYIGSQTEIKEQRLADEIIIAAWRKGDAHYRKWLETNPLNKHVQFVEG